MEEDEIAHNLKFSRNGLACCVVSAANLKKFIEAFCLCISSATNKYVCKLKQIKNKL